jgi:hypothetical protein
MPDSLQFLLWFLGVPAALAVIMLLLVCVEWGYWRIGHAMARCQARFDGWRMRSAEQYSRQEDQRAFLDWLESQTGTSQSSGAVDYELVEAHRQGELIRVLIEHEVPKAVSRCVETHRLMAKVTGAYHYSEIAYEPECYQLRARVVWLLAHGVDFLRTYPLRLSDARLLHNSIVLRKRALPTCRHCPYIELPVDEAPPLCPTAELVQVRNANHESKKK